MGSVRKHQRRRFGVLTAKQAVVGSSAAGAQEKGHVDSEGLFKQGEHPRGLAKTTGEDRALKSLAGLFGEGGEQLVESKLLKRLGRAHAADASKTELQAFLAGGEPVGQFRIADWITEMQLKILQSLSHNLNRASAGNGNGFLWGKGDLGGGREWSQVFPFDGVQRFS